ncbi:MAG: RnfABCDGE type electron transport complex subunit A [Oscillospiraceae bacterium]|nr:RnfABCDGE type electron transport complex subunit A [Oscillospiraceae bacterium]
MEIARGLIIILITGVLTENFILSKFLGICPFLGVSKKVSGSVGMGIAVIFVMVLGTAVTWPIYTFILAPLNVEYMRTIAFILIVALFVQLIEMVLRRKMPLLYESLGAYLALMVTNCAILGVTLLNIDLEYGFLYSIFNAFCAGLGFLMVMVIFSGVRGRVDRCDIPKALSGIPITFIAASIMSLSFMGFAGLIEGIFGI